MVTRKPDPSLSTFPLRPEIWHRVLTELQLSPQQQRIVELLLRGMKFKEIAREIRLAEPTIRTHMKRIYQRHGIADQVELMIRILEISQRLETEPSRPLVG